MPREKSSDKQELKVTDKRIFTSEGEVKEEFKANAETVAEAPRPEPAAPQADAPAPRKEKSKKPGEKAENPGTPFTNFLQTLIAQAYMSLGLLRNPYDPKPTIDLTAARQLIDIISLLEEKTKGNLNEEETDFLTMYLSELKLAFVQRNKTI